MASGFFKYFKALGILPVASTGIDSKGELEVLSSSGKLNYHDGTTASPQVTEAHSATLTNKTIDASSNTLSNIVNSCISSSAAIALTKLAALSNHNRALVSDNSGFVAESSVTSTELGYVSGVTSAIQTQFTGKVDTGTFTAHTGASIGVHGVSGSVVGTTDTQTLTNKSLSDSTTSIVDNSDPTIKINFNAAGTTGTSTTLTGSQTSNQVLTLPNATDTLVGKATTDTLTNKTLTGNTIASFTPDGSHTITVPAVTDTLVAKTTTDTLTNKTMGDALTLTQVATPANPTSGKDKLYVKSDDKLYILTSGGVETKAGGGLAPWSISTVYSTGDVVSYEKQAYIALSNHTSSGTSFETDIAAGGKWALLNQSQISPNLMLVGNNFEDGDVGGWQLFNTTLTSSIPTGALTLGSATGMTVAATSTNPLSGVYSLQVSNTASTNFAAGSGIISQAYSIDSLYQAKMLANRFAYQATTGASFQNYSGTSSNTWAVYIYDVTNSAWIQPAGVYNLVQSSGIGNSSSTWQTPSNMTRFRIALLCINATTGSSPAVNTIQTTFDDFYVGPQNIASGPAMSDWVAYTPTLGAGFGTPTNVSFFYKRSGDSCLVQGYFTAGTVAGSLASISLPSGLSLDTSKISINNTTSNPGENIGEYASDGGATRAGPLVTATATSTSLVYYGLNYSNSAILTPVNASSTIVSSSNNSIKFTVPISGWSSNSVMSADTDTRVIAAQYSDNANQAVTASVTDIPFATKLGDTHGAWSGTTFTAPVSGWYDICGSINFNSNATRQTKLYKNTSYLLKISDQTTSIGISHFNGAVYLLSGDVISIRTDTTSTLTSSATDHWIYISRRSGPAVIAASEKVYLQYTNNGGTSITASTTNIDFTTKVVDSHGAWDGTIFTAPRAGFYTFSGTVNLTTAGTQGLFVYKNGSQGLLQGIAISSAIKGISGGLSLIAGDQVSFRLDNSATLSNVNFIHSITICST